LKNRGDDRQQKEEGKEERRMNQKSSKEVHSRKTTIQRGQGGGKFCIGKRGGRKLENPWKGKPEEEGKGEGTLLGKRNCMEHHNHSLRDVGGEGRKQSSLEKKE